MLERYVVLCIYPFAARQDPRTSRGATRVVMVEVVEMVVVVVQGGQNDERPEQASKHCIGRAEEWVMIQYTPMIVTLSEA